MKVLVTGTAGFIGMHGALRLLARGDSAASVLEALSQGLTNKLLHAPTQALNELAGDERRALAESIARLFRIK